MIPYADFLYFLILGLYVLLPTVAVRLAFRFSQVWVVLATLAVVILQYQGGLDFGSRYGVYELGVVASYAAFEWALAAAYLLSRRFTTHRAVYYSVLALALFPLLIAKWLPHLAPGYQLGFLGISYVTFRSLDVIFSIHDKIITSLPAAQYLSFVFFFPTISSGPIDRYRRFATDWKSHPGREAFWQDLDGAVHRVFTGFLYKFILAALVRRYWMDPVSASTGLLATLSYMYAYSFYLFFDFAGYSLFAIGVSYLFGIHTPENFDRPFLAPNIRDFWNRWHITLSFWLRDHVYMRFVLAATKGRWFRGKYTASHLGFLLSFGLMGLWHGIERHYLIYGMYHAGLLVSYDIFSRWNKGRQVWGAGPLWRLLSILVTFHVVCFGFLIFSGRLGQ